MSKRKSITQSLSVQTNDMVFEDDDEIEEQAGSVAGNSSKGSVSRVSRRTKKTKAIFDPSEYNGPVHKRKKDALEAEKALKSEKSTSSNSATKDPQLKPVLTNSPKKAAAIASVYLSSPSKVKIESKESVIGLNNVKNKTVNDIVKKRLPMESKKPFGISQALPVIPAVSVVKEPSKRIQARKDQKRPSNDLASTSAKKKQRNSSITTDFDDGTTIEYKESDIPDVRHWTHQQVSQYFNANLGFSKPDSAVFLNEEIDGEALMIMKRTDIVTNKFQNLKLGTALKMWSHILKFQTGSNDPTQAWK